MHFSEFSPIKCWCITKLLENAKLLVLLNRAWMLNILNQWKLRQMWKTCWQIYQNKVQDKNLYCHLSVPTTDWDLHLMYCVSKSINLLTWSLMINTVLILTKPFNIQEPNGARTKEKLRIPWLPHAKPFRIAKIFPHIECKKFTQGLFH